MDPPQEELETLSMYGESTKIISFCKNIFLQITLILVAPLSFIFLSHSEKSMLSIMKIVLDLHNLRKVDTENSSYDDLFDALSVKYVQYWVTEVAGFTFLLVFSLLPTFTIIYAVTSYRKPMSFVFKAWYRLIITLVCNFTILFAHNILTILTLVMVVTQLQESHYKRLIRAILSPISVLYFIGFIYISVIWQIASLICLLEESYGFQAIVKSKELIKGKIGIVATIFVLINLCFGSIATMVAKFIVFGIGGLFLVLRALIFIFGLLVHIIMFLACKSPDFYTYLDHSYVLLDSIVLETEQANM